jgi:hypothetical protein
VVGGMVTFERCLGQDKTLFNIYFQDKFPAWDVSKVVTLLCS